MVTYERKYQALIDAPLHWPLTRSDTQIIEREGWYQLVTPASKSSSSNEIYLSDIAVDVSVVVEEVLKQYRANNSKFKWCVGPWTKPSNMHEALAPLAIASWDVSGMACSTSLPMTISDEIHIELVTPKNLDSFLSAFSLGWEVAPADVEATRIQIERSFKLPMQPIRYYVAFYNKTPVGTSSFTIKQDYAYLTGGVVLPEYRGKGIYKALVSARLKDLAAASIPLAVTHARKLTSAPILERVGFETVLTYKVYELS